MSKGTAPKRNLTPGQLVALKWDSANADKSLTEIFQHLQNKAQETIDWFLYAKARVSRCAKVIRIAAILLATYAGILPILAQIYTDSGRPPAWAQPAWASVFLVIAAVLALFDRFFGCSSSWMRYMVTQLRVRQLLEEFQLDWEAEKALWQGAHPTTPQVQQMLFRYKAFTTQLNVIIQDDVNKWVSEFQDALKQVDETLKVKPATTELGAISVTVTNGDQATGGWSLAIDRCPSVMYQGKTAALRDLVPGLRRVRVLGKIGGAGKQAESVATVCGGAVADVQLTL